MRRPGRALHHRVISVDGHRRADRRPPARVHLVDRRREQQVGAGRLRLGGVAVGVARIGRQVLGRRELQRVHEDRGDHHVALGRGRVRSATRGPRGGTPSSAPARRSAPGTLESRIEQRRGGTTMVVSVRIRGHPDQGRHPGSKDSGRTESGRGPTVTSIRDDVLDRPALGRGVGDPEPPVVEASAPNVGERDRGPEQPVAGRDRGVVGPVDRLGQRRSAPRADRPAGRARSGALTAPGDEQRGSVPDRRARPGAVPCQDRPSGQPTRARCRRSDPQVGRPARRAGPPRGPARR